LWNRTPFFPCSLFREGANLSTFHLVRFKRASAARLERGRDPRFNDICWEKGQDAPGLDVISALSPSSSRDSPRDELFPGCSPANRCTKARGASRAAICLGNNRRSVHFRTLRDSGEQRATRGYTFAGYDTYAIRCKPLRSLTERERETDRDPCIRSYHCLLRRVVFHDTAVK